MLEGIRKRIEWVTGYARNLKESIAGPLTTMKRALVIKPNTAHTTAAVCGLTALYGATRTLLAGDIVSGFVSAVGVYLEAKFAYHAGSLKKMDERYEQVAERIESSGFRPVIADEKENLVKYAEFYAIENDLLADFHTELGRYMKKKAAEKKVSKAEASKMVTIDSIIGSTGRYGLESELD